MPFYNEHCGTATIKNLALSGLSSLPFQVTLINPEPTFNLKKQKQKSVKLTKHSSHSFFNNNKGFF